jgi:hypothetical protein
LVLKSKTMSLDHPVHSRGLELSTFCMVPHFFFSSARLPVVQTPGLRFKPSASIFFLRAQMLGNVAGLIDQIDHNLVFNSLTKLIGVDVTTENLQASGFLSFFSSGVPVKPIEDRIRASTPSSCCVACRSGCGDIHQRRR